MRMKLLAVAAGLTRGVDGMVQALPQPYDFCLFGSCQDLVRNEDTLNTEGDSADP
jgi:hypothetical protein